MDRQSSITEGRIKNPHNLLVNWGQLAIEKINGIRYYFTINAFHI